MNIADLNSFLTDFNIFHFMCSEIIITAKSDRHWKSMIWDNTSSLYESSCLSIELLYVVLNDSNFEKN